MEPNWTVVAMRLFIAMLLGGVIGIERQISQKSAGLRTHMMVALGSALFMEISITMPKVLDTPFSDPTRIAAQIITGIGFLGAGAILHSRGLILGLTTAASIWLAAAVGMAVGGGLYLPAVSATALGVVILIASPLIDRMPLGKRIPLGPRKAYRTVRIQLRSETDAPSLRDKIWDSQLRIRRIRVTTDEQGTRIDARIEFDGREQMQFLDMLRAHPGVVGVGVDSR